MTEPGSSPSAGPGRLWVLFDGSPGSQAALLQTLALLQMRGGELRALYIDEPALARCAGLPIGAEVGAVSGRLRARTPVDHRHALVVRRLRAQTVLDHLLGAQAGPVQLESRSGRPLEVLSALVTERDWIISGRSGYASWKPARLGSLARALIEAPVSTVMIGSPSGRSHPGPWLLLLDDPAAAQDRVPQALELLGPSGSELRVVCEAEGATAGTATVGWIRQRIVGPMALQKLVQDLQPAGLIALAESALIRTGLAAGWLDRIDLPLVVLPG
jgi:nucleotide-binding universal stress UspA family protein